MWQSEILSELTKTSQLISIKAGFLIPRLLSLTGLSVPSSKHRWATQHGRCNPSEL